MADATTAQKSAGSVYDNWNFQRYRVQQGVAGGQFINAESTLVAAGPPVISAGAAGETANNTGVAVYPIGLLETFGLQQSRQLQRIFEIGSSRSYFIPGRTIGSITLGRTFYNGPNLLRALYAYYKGTAGDVTVEALNGSTQDYTSTYSPNWRNPGYENFFIDLASSLFAQPTGMACYFKDSNMDTYGGFYLESCYVQGHQMTVSSGSVLVMEGASMQYDLLVPLEVSTSGGAATPAQLIELEGA
jgi:hypothetical protein